MKIALVIFLCIVATSVQATIKEDLANTELSLIDVFHNALANDTDIKTTITEMIRQSTSARQVVSTAIAVSPGSIDQIIQSALEMNVPAEDIAGFCRTALTVREVEQIVVSILRQTDVEPEMVLSTCMSVVPESEIANMLATALQNVKEDMYARVISSVYESISADVDPLPLMSLGIANSGVWETLEDLNNNEIFDVLENSISDVSLNLRDIVSEPVSVEVLILEEVAASGS